MIMVQAIYVQRGETIDYVNGTGADITAGEVVALDTRIGVAATTIPVGVKGALNVMGVYDFPALTTEALTVGQAVYFKDNKIQVDDTSAVFAGWVVEPKVLAGSVARVKID